ncbi:hypothetical protein [uncultured Lactobacillus sp.]|uniref:hypothetical protein n=1 Tax=uncultured Lactobacillus sp. TaxID=153152 RepID=UPI0025D79FB9|nr:hypothetical protein [uncultured Lactobacillus sp.]
MTKYPTALKIEIFNKCLSHQETLARLKWEYNLDHTTIRQCLLIPPLRLSSQAKAYEY